MQAALYIACARVAARSMTETSAGEKRGLFQHEGVPRNFDAPGNSVRYRAHEGTMPMVLWHLGMPADIQVGPPETKASNYLLYRER